LFATLKNADILSHWMTKESFTMKDNIKKIKKYIKIVKFAATAATVAMAIYTLIPKNEKIKGIDTLPLETYSTQIQ